MSVLTVRVFGIPGAQGSKRHVGHGVMVESSKKVAPWRQDVVAAAIAAMEQEPGFEMFTGPVGVAMTFFFTRPKGHFRTGKNAHLLKDCAPLFVTSRAAGDGDKLMRSTCDALTTAGVWADDSLVARWKGAKFYGDREEPVGARIEIWPLQLVYGGDR